MPKRDPLIRSSVALRGMATGLTLLSLSAMSVFASTHVQNAAAPLKPTVASTNQQTTATAATPTPAPTSRRTTVTGRVTTTTQAARTRTKSS
jgi:hypothetical protein